MSLASHLTLHDCVQGLEFLHRAEIMHLDIKPDNGDYPTFLS